MSLMFKKQADTAFNMPIHLNPTLDRSQEAQN